MPRAGTYVSNLHVALTYLVCGQIRYVYLMHGFMWRFKVRVSIFSRVKDGGVAVQRAVAYISFFSLLLRYDHFHVIPLSPEEFSL